MLFLINLYFFTISYMYTFAFSQILLFGSLGYNKYIVYIHIKQKGCIMKKSIGPETLLFPVPSVLVGTYDIENKPNIMTAAWTGVINSNPKMISVSLRKATYSYGNILATEAFTISVPSLNYLNEVDYAGTKSGRVVNKFQETGLTPIKSDFVNAPFVEEFPVILECKLIKSEDLGLHTIFYGEILDTKIDEVYLKENNKFDAIELSPIGFVPSISSYYSIGDYVGKHGRVWPVSTLSDTPEAAAPLSKFIELFDNGRPSEDFREVFDFDNFVFAKGEMEITTFSAFSEWYTPLRSGSFDKSHVVDKMKVTEQEDGTLLLNLDMSYSYKTWLPGDVTFTRHSSRSKNEVILYKPDGSEHYFIKSYKIS